MRLTPQTALSIHGGDASAVPAVLGRCNFALWLAGKSDFWLAALFYGIGSYKRACGAGLLACGMAASFWLFAGSEGRELLLTGYYVWFVSLQMLVAAAATQVWMPQMSVVTENHEQGHEEQDAENQTRT